MSHWIFRGDFGHGQGDLGHQGRHRTVTDTLVSKYIMDLFYVTFYVILHNNIVNHIIKLIVVF